MAAQIDLRLVCCHALLWSTDSLIVVVKIRATIHPACRAACPESGPRDVLQLVRSALGKFNISGIGARGCQAQSQGLQPYLHNKESSMMRPYRLSSLTNQFCKGRIPNLSPKRPGRAGAGSLRSRESVRDVEARLPEV